MLDVGSKRETVTQAVKGKKKILCMSKSIGVQEQVEYRRTTSSWSVWEHVTEEQGVAGDEIRWDFYNLGKRLELFLQIIGNL